MKAGVFTWVSDPVQQFGEFRRVHSVQQLLHSGSGFRKIHLHTENVSQTSECTYTVHTLCIVGLYIAYIWWVYRVCIYSSTVCLCAETPRHERVCDLRWNLETHIHRFSSVTETTKHLLTCWGDDTLNCDVNTDVTVEKHLDWKSHFSPAIVQTTLRKKTDRGSSLFFFFWKTLLSKHVYSIYRKYF